MRETIWTVILAAPISAALITILVWLLRNWITARLTGSIKQVYDKALESHKSMLRKEVEIELTTLNSELKSKIDIQIENHKTELKARLDSDMEFLKARVQREFHISKSQFDVELTSFRSVWEAISALVDDTVRIQYLYNPIDFGTMSKGERKAHADKADASFFMATKIFQNALPFLPEAVEVRASRILQKCKDNIDYFYRVIASDRPDVENFDPTEVVSAMKSEWRKLADLIRERLFNSATVDDENVEP